MLRGRRSELEVVGRLLGDVHAGGSGVLVLRGEAGIGKSALMEHLQAEADATGCRVARAAGVESEMELAFAGLHQLCAPLLDRLGRLPAPQGEALEAAFGLRAGDPPDRFLVGLAVLGLLSEASGEGPLACLVDDAQWLDRASAQALAFVARRLLAEPVALVFAVREPSEDRDLAGLPELVLEGLDDPDARALLASVVPGRLDERVRARILAEVRGNPLALLELPRGLSAAELAGGFGRPDARPLAGRIEQSFRRQLQSLPPATQRFLLTAAAEPLGDVTLLWRAVDRLGIGADAATAAEAAGLVEVGTRVRFRHPLVRAAAYRAADLPDRRAVHAALAAVTDPEVDPDRRAWHRAQAAAGPDEAVADELERSAERAQRRGGVAAAAALLERATELTPDRGRRSTRALAAAQAKFEAAAPDAAYQLIATAELGPLDEVQRTLLARLRAQVVVAHRRRSDAVPLLLDAARRLDALGHDLAGEAYVDALGSAVFTGRLGGPPGMREVAAAARATDRGARSGTPGDRLLDGLAVLLTDGHAAGLPPLRDALSSFRREELRDRADAMRWLRLAYPLAHAAAAHQLWDLDAWDDLATRSVRLAREAGALAFLPLALASQAGVLVHRGDFGAASVAIEESDAITAATGHVPLCYAAMVLVAWRGDEEAAVRFIEAEVEAATARGEGMVLTLAGMATAVLHNGLGRHADALRSARDASDHDGFSFVGWALAERVEAAARSDAPDEAAEALARLAGRAHAAGTDWALGVLARSRALVADGPAAEAHHQEALARLGRSGVVVHRARAHLLYGEWLRREQRRADARRQLAEAHELFDRMGAAAFAGRALRELLAIGATVSARTTEVRTALTAQEAQIARLAAARHTNAEIGGQLYISPRTVEYHLGKVFTKLGVASRRDLGRALHDLDRLDRAPAAG